MEMYDGAYAGGSSQEWPYEPKWEPWFAWRPVRKIDGRWVWWRVISCRRILHARPLYEYAEPFLVAMGLPLNGSAPLKQHGAGTSSLLFD